MSGQSDQSDQSDKVRKVDEVRSHDLVVIGAGIAGLTVALEVAHGDGAPRKVALLSKVPFNGRGAGGCSPWAQGGIAAAVGEGDSPSFHAADTVTAGAGLTDPTLALALASEAPGRIERLLELGARLDREANGALSLGQEAAHGHRRILHANGDATGAELVRALSAAVATSEHVALDGETEALDLIVHDGRIAGVLARDGGGRILLYQTPAVVLATGGLGQLYLRSTNPAESTGDGLALAARAGARLVDLEFVQFHPTALAVAQKRGLAALPLLTEALRGEGAILVDDAGERFMLSEHRDAELAPRDIVARAIWARLEEGREVFLDARHCVGSRFPERFPTVFDLCQRHGFDPRTETVPVTPAAHFHMGGVAVDRLGRSSLIGLWACGEVAGSGVHGANRLASNSLLEGMVYGARVARDIRLAQRPQAAESAVLAEAATLLEEGLGGESSGRGGSDWEAVDTLRELMWRHVGLVRDEHGLRRVLTQLRRMRWKLPGGGILLRNLHTIAGLVTSAALLRRESRGGHFRQDFPEPAADWRRRVYWRAGQAEVGPRVDAEPEIRPAEGAFAAQAAEASGAEASAATFGSGAR